MMSIMLQNNMPFGSAFPDQIRLPQKEINEMLRAAVAGLKHKSYTGSNPKLLLTLKRNASCKSS